MRCLSFARVDGLRDRDELRRNRRRSGARGPRPGPGDILSNIVFSQLDAHRPYGGVVPEIAARAHVERLDGIVEEALAQRSSASGISTRWLPRQGRG